MGKRIISRRRGKGSPTYRSPSHKGKGDVEHARGEVTGEVVDIQHDPGRNAPVAVVEYEDSEDDGESVQRTGSPEKNGAQTDTQSESVQRNVLVPEGVAVGDEIAVGPSAEIDPGNTLPLREIPEGVPICNIELQPGDGGKIARSSGTYGFVVTHAAGHTTVRLPSGSFKELHPDCRATIGQVAAGGRTEKEFRKAGDKHHRAKAKGRLYPRVSAVAMNAVDHPFGGSTKPGKPKTTSRHASPGSKVGSIAAKRSGKKKKD